jgi:hypothetical protein
MMDTITHRGERVHIPTLLVAQEHARTADLNIAIGTSLKVPPASSLPLLAIRHSNNRHYMKNDNSVQDHTTSSDIEEDDDHDDNNDDSSDANDEKHDESDSDTTSSSKRGTKRSRVTKSNDNDTEPALPTADHDHKLEKVTRSGSSSNSRSNIEAKNVVAPELVIINLQWTAKDRFASLKINAKSDDFALLLGWSLACYLMPTFLIRISLVDWTGMTAQELCLPPSEYQSSVSAPVTLNTSSSSSSSSPPSSRLMLVPGSKRRR